MSLVHVICSYTIVMFFLVMYTLTSSLLILYILAQSEGAPAECYPHTTFSYTCHVFLHPCVHPCLAKALLVGGVHFACI